MDNYIKTAFLGIKGDFNENSGAGIQRYTTELIKHLSKNRVNIDKLEYKNLFDYSLNTTFKNFKNYDIIHNTGIKLTMPLRKEKAKFIVTIHDIISVTEPTLYNERYIPKLSFFNLLKKNMLLKYSAIAIRSSIFASDYIITDANMVKKELIQLGYPKEQLFVVNLGVDKRFIESPIPTKRNKAFTIGYLGSFFRKKNVKFAIDAFKIFKSYDGASNSLLEIWGSKKSPEYNYLHSLTGNDKQILFKGFAPEDRLIEIYDRFDIAIFPILYAGFELEILEAQARGIPVIIYKNSKIPDEVKKYCFKAKDPMHASDIITHIKANGYEEKVKRKAIRYARSFTWEKCARETLKVYNSVI